MAILKVNNCGDPVGMANPITLSSNVATTATWPSAPSNMPNVASPDILKLSVEPSTPNEEIIYVTAYTSGATSATVTRAAEGPGTARTHPGTAWVHGPTAADFSPMTLAGDMEIGGANGALTRLPVGTNGYIMAASSGAPTWIPLTTQAGDLVVGQNPGGATTLLRLGANGTVLTVSGGTANWVASYPRVVAATATSGVQCTGNTNNQVLYYDPFSASGGTLTSAIFRVSWAAFMGTAGTLVVPCYTYDGGVNIGNYMTGIQGSNQFQANGPTVSYSVMGIPLTVKWNASQTGYGILVNGQSSGNFWIVATIERLA
jgi:hypothetical protein